MNKSERQAYQAELKRVAKQLELPLAGNIEETIILHCLCRMREWIDAHGQPNTLSELLELFAPSLNIKFEEVYHAEDLACLLQRIPPEREPAMLQVRAEFGDGTDAVTILRQSPMAWEVPYLAIINCQGRHELRRYFTKWHEVVHRLLEGQQLSLALRRTYADRPEPGEVLVDRVAAALGFYPEIFEPIVREELEREGRLTFETVDRIRERIVPEASREATLRACLRYCPRPVWFLRCAMGLKRDEERALNRLQRTMLPEVRPAPEPKLRVVTTAHSPAAQKRGIRFHPSMRIPESSLVTQAFCDPWGFPRSGTERLEAWDTSADGPIGCGEVRVDAEGMGNEVWALIHLLRNVHR